MSCSNILSWLIAIDAFACVLIMLLVASAESIIQND